MLPTLRAGGKSVDYEGLERLVRLRDAGILTEEEFAAQKHRLLLAVPDVPGENTRSPSNRAPLAWLCGAGLVAAIVLGTALGWDAQPASERAEAKEIQAPPVATDNAASGQEKAYPATASIEPNNSSPSLADDKSSDSNHNWITAYPQPIRPLLRNWIRAEEACRGGSFDNDAEMQRTCDVRDAAAARLRRFHYCYGREEQASHEFKWHRCNEGSNNFIGEGLPDGAIIREYEPDAGEAPDWAAMYARCLAEPESLGPVGCTARTNGLTGMNTTIDKER